MSAAGSALARLLGDRATWPGMTLDEVAVLRTYMQKNAPFYTSVEADVRIGIGKDPGPSFTDAQRAQAIQDTKLRPDVIAWRDAQPFIIEVKKEARVSAIGQLLAYKAAWIAEGRSFAAPICVLLAAFVDPNVYPLAKLNAVQVITVEVDFGTIRPATSDRKAGIEPTG